MEINPGLICSQQVRKEAKVQNGHSRIHKGAVERRSFHDINRHIRCLSSHSHSPFPQEIPEICIPREDLPIQSSSHGTDQQSQNLHKSGQSHLPISSQAPDPHFPVPRRLASAGAFSTGSGCKYTSSVIYHSTPRLDHQSREIGPDSSSGFPVSIIPFPPGPGQGCSHGGEVEENSRENSSVHAENNLYSQRVAVCPRTANSHRKVGEIRNVTYSTNSSPNAPSVVPLQRQTNRYSSSLTSGQTGTPMVDCQRQCDVRSSNNTSTTSSSSVHGCQPHRLWRNHEWPGGVRNMEQSGTTPTQQCPGIVRGLESVTAFPGPIERNICTGSFRQCCSCCLHQKAGRDSISNPVVLHPTNVQLAGESSNHHKVQTYSRETQCSGGFSVKDRTDHSNRVVNSSSNSSGSVECMGEAANRSLRDPPQLQTSNICVTSSRQHGTRGGCPVHGLEQSVCICIPSNSNSGNGSTENTTSSVSNNSDSTNVAQPKVVPSTSRASGGLPQEDPRVEKTAQTTPVINLPRQSGGVQSSRLEIIQQSHRARGFSEEVTAKMARPHKKSTQDLYEGKWNIYCSWCKERDLNPIHSTNVEVADFLLHLHQDKKLMAVTIEGYRTAISNTLKAVNPDIQIGTDPYISSLMSNFERTRVKNKSRIPPWNLSIVLRKLSQSPYEPMKKADMKYITRKTVFLLALASGKRRSELHAMRKDIMYTEHYSSVTILPNPEFVSKTQLAGKGGNILKPVDIKSLNNFVDDRMSEDLKLCPVRALRYYLKRTAPFRRNRDQLFISYQENRNKDIHPNTVSSWIKNTILDTHEGANEEDLKITGVKAHQTRGVAASLALITNASLDEIMNACSWKAHTTFSSFYLKDLALIRDEMHHLGPVIAAGHVAKVSGSTQ